jgi:hypothetical protein
MAFKDDNWQIGYHRFTICTVALADPDTVRDTTATSVLGASPTLRFCDDTRVRTYDSNDYYPGLLSFQTRHAGNVFSGRVSDADANLQLSTLRYFNQQRAGAAPQETDTYFVKLPQLLRNYLWDGATVTVLVVCERPDGTQTAQQIFKGQVRDPQFAEAGLDLWCVEDKEFNIARPDTDGPADASSNTRAIVNRTDHPDAPDEALGRSLPIVYSNRTAVIEGSGGLAVSPQNLDGLWPTIVTNKRYSPAGESDAGRLATITVLCSSAGGTPSLPSRHFLFAPELSEVCHLTNSGTGGAESIYQIDWWLTTVPEADSTAILYLKPEGLIAETSGVSDAGLSFDRRSDTYATIACSGSAEALDLSIPFPSPLGEIVGSVAFIVLAAGGTGVDTGGGASSVNGDFGFWSVNDASYHYSLEGDLTKTRIESGGYFEADPLSSTQYDDSEWASWRFRGLDGSSNAKPISFRARVSTSGATARVVAMGAQITFRPEGFQYIAPKTGRRFDISGRLVRNGPFRRGDVKEVTPDIAGARFYSGGGPTIKDNGSGTYTGTAGLAIVNPCHVFKHFTSAICGENVNNFQGSTSFGSFSECADDLDAQTDALATNENWELVFRILEPQSPDEVRSRLQEHAPLSIFRSMYDNKWKALAYQQSPSSEKYFTDPNGNNYKVKYTTDVLPGSVRVSKTPLSECVNEVHVRYGMYAPTGAFTRDAWVGPSGSDDGDGTRDQNTTSPNNREARAAGSRDDLNVKGTLTVEADGIASYYSALVLRNYLFDRLHRPRIVLTMDLGPRFIGLEPGMCLLVDNEMQDYEPVPWYPGDGVGSGTAKEWDDLIFFVRDLAITIQGGVSIVSVTLEEIR